MTSPATILGDIIAPIDRHLDDADLARRMARDYNAARTELLERTRQARAESREQQLRHHRAGASGTEVVQARTAAFDRLIARLFDLCAGDLRLPGGCCLLALGGYGRGELNPFSDIDLMFYYAGKDAGTAVAVSERVLYLLWDLGLEVGYSVRTAKDCLEQAARDLTVRTALIDVRRLAGEESHWLDFEEKVLPTVLGRDSRGFVRDKLEEQRLRRQKYGSSVYLLEPNIKEGEGGLRDLHTAFWVAQVKFKCRTPRELVVKGVLTDSRYQEFRRAFDWLWRIRNELHFLSDRKNEQLFFDLQEKIAAFLGYVDQRKAKGVEQFMQDYYAHAVEVGHITDALIERVARRDDFLAPTRLFRMRRQVGDGFSVLRGELMADDPATLFQRRPAALMETFELMQRQDVTLSQPLKEAIRDHLGQLKDEVRRSREMVDSFFRILRFRRRLAATLRAMHECRLLGRFIPEFDRIYCKVQHDVYHTYTVDVHTLFAVEEVERLWAGAYAETLPLLTRVAGEIDKGELLLLAVLFHDIGKGEGRNHSLRGKEMVPTIARRLGLKREDTQRLEFLVEHHLDMAHIAQHRDLHDPKLVQQFAARLGDSETLRMLYVLTYADIKAVGPDVWTDWKAGLLEELYCATYDVLEKGGFSREARSERMRSRRRKVVEVLEGELPTATVAKLLRGFGPRYLLVCSKADIVHHLRLMTGRGRAPLALAVEQHPERGYTALILSTLDHPGLFSQIGGVLAANGVNILGAQIYTNSNGEVIDTLQVNLPGKRLLDKAERLRRLRADLEAVIEGRVRVAELVRRRKQPDFMTSRPKPRMANRVEIDNAISDDYTVIDIFAHDRLGLLYHITRTLTELGLYIDVSKISTRIDQAADTFYVKDIFGTKITREDKLDEIRQRLLDCLDEEL